MKTAALTVARKRASKPTPTPQEVARWPSPPAARNVRHPSAPAAPAKPVAASPPVAEQRPAASPPSSPTTPAKPSSVPQEVAAKSPSTIVQPVRHVVDVSAPQNAAARPPGSPNRPAAPPIPTAKTVPRTAPGASKAEPTKQGPRDHAAIRADLAKLRREPPYLWGNKRREQGERTRALLKELELADGQAKGEKES